MNFELYIAKRYFRSKRKLNFITIISLISIIGISIGTAALIIVLSVFNGFNGLVTSILVGFDPHIRIERLNNEKIISYNSIDSICKNITEVKGISPYISEKAMIMFGSSNRAIMINGVDDKLIGNVSGVKENIINGEFKFSDSNNVSSIILGLVLADRLGTVKGDTLYLISSAGMENSLTQLSTPNVFKFKIVGVFESNNKDYDSYFAYISLNSARELFKIKNGFSGVELRLNDINQSENVKKILTSKLSSEYQISSWYDLHKDLYSMMKIERWIAYIILCLIIAVATFNMLGSLTMTVIEKKRDIGVLLSMGSSRKSILRIFLFEGLLIGIIGTIIGLVLGYILCVLQIEYSLFPLDPIFIIPAIPIELRWTDFFAVSGASIFLSFISTIYPAIRASKVLPVEAIRWE